MAIAEARRHPGRRAKWAELQKGSGGIYHSIRCENPDCRRPFRACHHVWGNGVMIERSSNPVRYHGYWWDCGEKGEAVEKRGCDKAC